MRKKIEILILKHKEFSAVLYSTVQYSTVQYNDNLEVPGSIAGHIVPLPVSPQDDTVLLRVSIPIVGCVGPPVVVAPAGPLSPGVGALRQDVIPTQPGDVLDRILQKSETSIRSY